jgi:hypothetical protein
MFNGTIDLSMKLTNDEGETTECKTKDEGETTECKLVSDFLNLITDDEHKVIAIAHVTLLVR